MSLYLSNIHHTDVTITFKLHLNYFYSQSSFLRFYKNKINTMEPKTKCAITRDLQIK